MKLKRIMIAAPKSGSGKTTITIALLQALKDRGKKLISYKCGPDYIDPMFHRKVIDIPSKNLDTFFTSEETTKYLFLRERNEDETVVMEGVMGLYDGLGGVRKEGSAYHLASVTKTPIILVVDAKGMGKSVVALIAGFLQYDREKLIKGVILNRMTKGYFDIIAPVIEEELGVKALGYFPTYNDFKIESRHLGLVMPDEMADIKAQIKGVAGKLSECVDIDLIEKIAGEAGDLEVDESKLDNSGVKIKEAFEKTKQKSAVLSIESISKKGYASDEGISNDTKSPVIAVAKDEAFCFYYEDNLKLLEAFGAKLKYFSPIHDKALPGNTAGILLGGGYPELYANLLEKNEEMREAIKNAYEKKMPIVAECGGFMYLHKTITDKDGHEYKMVGALDADCKYTGKLVRFGYIDLKENAPNYLKDGETIKGHEFHYFDSTDNGESVIATKPTTGKSYKCIKDRDNLWIGFPHLYYPSNVDFAENFVSKCKGN